MNAKKMTGIASLFIFSVFLMNASAADPTFEIGPWANFCQGAVSHTFDDYPYTGTAQLVGTGQAAFDAKGLHMTLFVITGSVTDWSKLETAYAKGHEIASHTVTHNSTASELQTSQDAIKTNVPGEMCVSLAYPNGNAIGGCLKYYIAARNIQGANNPKTPSDFAQINTQGFGSGAGGYKNDAASMNSWADAAASGNKWGTAMHHGIGSASDPKHSWAMTNIDEMVKHLDYLDKNRAKIWCETFGNVARYIKERDVAKVTVKSSDDKSITLTLTHTLADSIYNFPLTLRTLLPDGWTNHVVTQKSKVVHDTVVTVSSKQYIMFNAVPNGGDIAISPAVSVKHSTSLGFDQNLPVKQLKASLAIDPSQFGGTNLTVTFFDLRGKIIANHTIARNASSFNLPIDKFNQSELIVKISGGNKTYVMKLMPQL